MLLKDSLGNSLSLSKDDSLKLELSLNTSKYEKEWIHIGDKLYYFYTGEINNKELIVTPYQFKFLMSALLSRLKTFW